MARIFGTAFPDLLSSTAFNDEMYGFDGNDTMRTSGGNDYMDGGAGFDTADYSSLGRSITVLPRGFITKNGVGTDRLVNVERIVAPIGQINTISGATSTGAAAFTINLANNSMILNNVPFTGTALSLTVQNFSNVLGTFNNDSITGNSAANFLSGLAGNDTLAGGAGNDGLNGGTGNDVLIGNGGVDTLVGDSGTDVLLGTDNIARGAGEFDQLTGGADADGFVLGDRSGGYYKFSGALDRVRITDFSSSDLIQVGVGELYTTQRTSQGFNLFAFTSRGLDQVAEVQTPSFVALPTGNFRLGAGQRLGNFVGA